MFLIKSSAVVLLAVFISACAKPATNISGAFPKKIKLERYRNASFDRTKHNASIILSKTARISLSIVFDDELFSVNHYRQEYQSVSLPASSRSFTVKLMQENIKPKYFVVKHLKLKPKTKYFVKFSIVKGETNLWIEEANSYVVYGKRILL